MSDELDVWQEIKKQEAENRAYGWNIFKWYFFIVIFPLVLIRKGWTGVVAKKTAWKLKVLDKVAILILLAWFGLYIFLLGGMLTDKFDTEIAISLLIFILFHVGSIVFIEFREVSK